MIVTSSVHLIYNIYMLRNLQKVVPEIHLVVFYEFFLDGLKLSVCVVLFRRRLEVGFSAQK